MKLETKILDIIEGKKSAPVTKALLSVMSRGYQAGVAIRNAHYGLFNRGHRLSIPVVSVGSVVAGGTGKTPFVRFLAEKLAEKMSVAILSRGYRRKGKGVCVVDEGVDPHECGDEPYWLAKKIPDAKVIVGSNRIETGERAQAEGADVVVLDDGMQHRRLHRDLEIVVLHADDLFGKGFYLPRGLLRDSLRRLRDADLIVVNGVGGKEELEDQLRPYTQAPIMGCGLQVENGAEFASKKVATFCAIASPGRFTATLKSLGCDIVESIEKPDHLTFEEEELEQLANRALDLGAEFLVCTEKDEVKLGDSKFRLPVKALKTTTAEMVTCPISYGTRC